MQACTRHDMWSSEDTQQATSPVDPPCLHLLLYFENGIKDDKTIICVDITHSSVTHQASLHQAQPLLRALTSLEYIFIKLVIVTVHLTET